MALRPKTLLRAVIVIGATALVTAALMRPSGSRPSRSNGGVALPLPLPRDRVTASGLIAVDAAGLKERIRRSNARGVVVNAWASWCGSCKEELPLLSQLKGVFGTDIDIWLVSVDEPEGQPAAKAMLHELFNDGPSFVVDEPLDAFKTAMNPRWPGMLPATFLFDRTAKLRYFWGGTVYEKEITPLLRRYLAGEVIDGEADFGLAPGATTR